MNNPINIAVDAMGGENSPKKVIEGIVLHSLNSDRIFYNIFGNQKIIDPIILKSKISKDRYKIIHTDNSIKDSDSPLSAAKKGKDTSMWMAIESLKKMSHMQ